MEGKDSFILYTKYIHIFKALSLEQRGVLITHIFEYVNDNIPEAEEDNLQDVTLKIAWLAIKSDLKEDLKKWNNIVKRNQKNGLKGGRPKKKENPKNPVGIFDKNEKPKKPKKADSDSEYDCDNELNKVSKDTMSGKPDLVKEVIDYLNKTVGSHFQDCKSNRRLIEARLKENRTLDDFKYVIMNKWLMWRGTEWEKFLRPETLFNATKFESYLNEPKVRTIKENPIYDKNGGFEEI